MPDAPPPSSAILSLLNESLSLSPDRRDLWMTRFDILRSLGHKPEFARAVTEASARPSVLRELDWQAVRRLWAEMSPDERFPGDAGEVPGGGQAQPARRARVRRFNEIAMEIAGPQLSALAREWTSISAGHGFLEDFMHRTGLLLQRPTPLEFSPALSRHAGEGRRIYVKREDKRRVPAEAEHAAAQCYVASRLGKSGVVTGSDVDRHATETATAARFFRLSCTVIVRPEDFEAKPAFIAGLEALEADVVAVPPDGLLSRDPREGAVRVWLDKLASHQLVLSLGMAPAPYTAIANAFQSLLGREAEAQYQEMASEQGRLRTVVAAVASEADAIGFALPFLGRKEIPIAFAEPAPGGVKNWRTNRRLQAYNGQIREHSWLRGVGRIQHVAIADSDAESYHRYLKDEGVETGLEDARAIALTLMLSRNDPAPRDFLVLLGA